MRSVAVPTRAPIDRPGKPQKASERQGEVEVEQRFVHGLQRVHDVRRVPIIKANRTSDSGVSRCLTISDVSSK
jgi:hypothetical protein